MADPATSDDEKGLSETLRGAFLTVFFAVCTSVITLLVSGAGRDERMLTLRRYVDALQRSDERIEAHIAAIEKDLNIHDKKRAHEGTELMIEDMNRRLLRVEREKGGASR